MKDTSSFSLDDWIFRAVLAMPTGIALEFFTVWLTASWAGGLSIWQWAFQDGINATIVRLGVFHLLGWLIVLADWDNIVYDAEEMGRQMQGEKDEPDFRIEHEGYIVEGTVRTKH